MDNAGQDELCSGRTADRPEREAVGLGQSEKFGHAVASRWRRRRQQALAHLWGQLHRFGKLAEGQRAAAGVVSQGNGLRCRLGGRRDLQRGAEDQEEDGCSGCNGKNTGRCFRLEMVVHNFFDWLHNGSREIV